jgi:hypothetical protein
MRPTHVLPTGLGYLFAAQAQELLPWVPVLKYFLLVCWRPQSQDWIQGAYQVPLPARPELRQQVPQEGLN